MLVKGKKIDLRLVSIEDAEFILKLRLDKKKNRFISAVEDDLDKQKRWIENYKSRELSGDEYYFVIVDKLDCRFGVVRLYDFVGSSFCWGSWVLIEGSPAYMAIESALLVYEYSFNNLAFNKAHFDVRIKNSKVVAFHQRFGAQIVAEDAENYYFDYTKAAYEKIKIRYKKYII